MKLYSNFTKRLFDFIVSAIGLILSLIVTIPTGVALLMVNSGTPFFYQLRPGKNGKLFRIVKFKTMNDRRDKFGYLLPDEVRLTTIGKIVRKLSIDELPQLINVMKGDMSLIGPRPLLVDYLPLYTNEQLSRHKVRPGITGWAQVNGRNLCLLSKKFEYDVWYVNNVSFALDCKIVLKTIQNILQHKDVGEGATTMEQVDDLNFAQRMNKRI